MEQGEWMTETLKRRLVRAPHRSAEKSAAL
jgi:hypothetical protein